MVAFPDPRSRPPYHMHAMILRQPEFLAETMRRVRAAAVGPFLGHPRRLLLTGCGTSFYAAMYGARALQESFPSIPVAAVNAYDVAYAPLDLRGATVLAVSHSGATPTTNRALSKARRAGCRTIGIVGLPGTPMERHIDRALVIGSFHDRSWANTMSYTTQLAAFAHIASRGPGANARVIRRALRSLPRTVAKALRSEQAVRRIAKRLAGRTRATFLGTDLDEVTAFEAALKIRETSSLPASAYHVEQFLHGPFLALDRTDAVVMLRSRSDGARWDTIRRALAATGAHLIAVGEGPGVDIAMPSTHRVLRPIVSAVPMQFLAYYAALARGTNPDIMRTDIPRLRAGVEALFQ